MLHYLLPGNRLKKLTLSLLASVTLLFISTTTTAQTTPELEIYHVPDEQFLQYIQDSLLFGGGKISQPQFFGRPNGRDLFRTGNDLGFERGIILSNGHVFSTTTIDGGDNKSGHQTAPYNPENPNGLCDSLGPYVALPPDQLRDADMDWVLGYLLNPGNPKTDTAVDPTVIMFKFKPYYDYIKMRYVFASEEYVYDDGSGGGGAGGGGGDPNDLDFTGATMADFMAILLKQSPGQPMNAAMIVSNVGSDLGPGSPPKLPVCVKTVNHEHSVTEYVNNKDKSFIFDGLTIPLTTTHLADTWVPVNPCQTYWIKVGVADFRNGMVVPYQGSDIDLSYLANSAVFLEAFGLISGYGLEWTIDYAITNNAFAPDSALVEGGCSDIVLTIKTNVMTQDTVHVRLRIDGATPADYVISPPLLYDSLMVIPDSATEVSYLISPVDDNINEGANGIEKWFIRYQMDPCDIPIPDTSGFGTATQGYSGEIRVKVHDYNPYVNTSKTYGPNPANIYHCGATVPITITDILSGGIPPYTYFWSNPPQLANQEIFNTTINGSPDYAICTITDRCTGVTPDYVAGSDTVIIYSQLTVQGSPSQQLCEQGELDIKVQSTNVGRNFTTVWHFEGNPIVPPATDSIYTVTWADYGNLAPADLHFTCHVTDNCGNTASDEILVTFYAIAEITGPSLICIGDPIQLTCTDAQTYTWYRQDNPSVTLGTSQVLNYTPPAAGMHTICVRILNNCGEIVTTCYQFEVSQLTCAMTLNNGTNFSVCPNVPFTLRELNAYDGWHWTWQDNGGQNYSSTGMQQINLSLHDAGPHQVQVIAYNEYGCYDTLERTVTVYPYAQLQAFTEHASVCRGYPTELSASPNGPVSINNYLWSATPPDNSLVSQQNSPNPVVTPLQTTTYKCKILDNHGCYDSTTVTVDVREPIAGTIIAYPTAACTEKQVQLNFQPLVNPLPGASYYWQLDGASPPTSTNVQPTVLWATPGQKHVQLTISEPGCEETFDLMFTVYIDPLAGFSATNNMGCQPIEASFFNQSVNVENPSYLWDFGDGTTSDLANPSHLYEQPGRYDVTLTVTNSTGCTNTLTINDIVEVYEVPVADFSAEPQAATIDNPTIRFTEGINIPYSIIQWDFGDGGTNSGESNPRHTYGAPGSYMVVMYTETEHGCWDRDTLEVGILEDMKIFVPNAFSPNGDGKNDCFSVGGTTGDIIEVFRVIIYSRWGEQVYESAISDPYCVWDGRDRSGNVVTPDTYIYRIFGKNFRGAKKVFEGMVTIVK